MDTVIPDSVAPAAAAGAPAPMRPVNVTQNNSAHIPQHAPAVHAGILPPRQQQASFTFPQQAPPTYASQTHSVVPMDDNTPFSRTDKVDFSKYWFQYNNKYIKVPMVRLP